MGGFAITTVSGVLRRPAEIKDNGFVKFSIPVDNRKNKAGERTTTWYNFTLFPRNDAPHPVSEFLAPGKVLLVTARLEETTNAETGKTYRDYIVQDIQLIADAAQRPTEEE